MQIFVRRLIDKGANASGALDFNTALHFAAYLGFGNIAMLLIEHGANTMDVDGSGLGRVPLEVAIQAGSVAHLDYEEVHMYDTCAALLVQQMTPCRYYNMYYTIPCSLFQPVSHAYISSVKKLFICDNNQDKSKLSFQALLEKKPKCKRLQVLITACH